MFRQSHTRKAVSLHPCSPLEDKEGLARDLLLAKGEKIAAFLRECNVSFDEDALFTRLREAENPLHLLSGL